MRKAGIRVEVMSGKQLWHEMVDIWFLTAKVHDTKRHACRRAYCKDDSHGREGKDACHVRGWRQREGVRCALCISLAAEKHLLSSLVWKTGQWRSKPFCALLQEAWRCARMARGMRAFFPRRTSSSGFRRRFFNTLTSESSAVCHCRKCGPVCCELRYAARGSAVVEAAGVAESGATRTVSMLHFVCSPVVGSLCSRYEVVPRDISTL